MITGFGHLTMVVRDQEEALKFYTEKLGFEKRMDATMGSSRWLTVAPNGCPTAITLWDPRMWQKPEPAEESLKMVGKQPGWVYECDDCQKTYEELASRGVKFSQPPTQRPYGVEAVFEDLYGNGYVLVQPAAHQG